MDSLDRTLSLQLIERDINPIVSTPSTSDISGALEKNSALIDFADYIKNDGTHVYDTFILRKGMKAPRLVRVFEQSLLDSLIDKNNGSKMIR